MKKLILKREKTLKTEDYGDVHIAMKFYDNNTQIFTQKFTLDDKIIRKKVSTNKNNDEALKNFDSIDSYKIQFACAVYAMEKH
ncbi:hypothetical protein L3V83_15150 [Thiotrichales bacterium 19X7-9]|nr:hypothetical protein [Thiotrichales bacterium 19X7-9]